MRSETLAKATVTLLLLSVVAVWYGGPVPSLPQAHAATRNFALDGRASSGWNATTPGPTVTVLSGDTVIISLTASDGITHQLFVDVNRNTQADCPSDKCSPNFQSPSPISHSFTVDFAPGTYGYYCTYHPGTMLGTFAVQGFTVSSNPSSVVIAQGSSETSTITVTSVAGFSGDVALTANVSPSGPTASFNPTTVTVPASGTASSTLTISTTGSTPTGSYAVEVVGTSDAATDTTTVTANVVVSGFAVSANPSSLTIAQGSIGTSTITVSSVGGFAGDVSLSANISPSGPTASFNPAVVSVPADGTASSMITITTMVSTVPGDYVVDVVGANDSVTQTTTVTVTVVAPDFTITLSPTSLTLAQGRSGTASLTVSSQAGFSGTVALTTAVSPLGPTVSLNTTSVSLSSGGTRHVNLNVTALDASNANVPVGSYTVSITGTGGSKSHTANVSLTVTSAAPSQTALDYVPLAAGIVAAIVLLALLVYLVRRRSSRRTPKT